jgi:hypothetical protein
MSFKSWRRWAGETVVCMASGPSMCAEDAEYVRGKARAITVNTTFRLAPWADVHYSSDDDWWRLYIGEMAESCTGEFWSGHPVYEHHLIQRCPYDRKLPGISNTPGVIGWGGNSGFCALGLAHQFGAARIVLLGYDQRWNGSQGHWHGSHPEELQNRRPGFARWAAWYEQAAKDFDALGVQIVNASRATTLTGFERANLRDVL